MYSIAKKVPPFSLTAIPERSVRISKVIGLFLQIFLPQENKQGYVDEHDFFFLLFDSLALHYDSSANSLRVHYRVSLMNPDKICRLK